MATVQETVNRNPHCPQCGQHMSQVAAAEKRLPGGPIDIVRCSGCKRALFYSSRAHVDYQALAVAVQEVAGITPPPGRAIDAAKLLRLRLRLAEIHRSASHVRQEIALLETQRRPSN